MTVELISQLNELHQMPGGNERREKMHWVIKALIDNAMDDDNTAILAIFDRLEGCRRRNRQQEELKMYGIVPQEQKALPHYVGPGDRVGCRGCRKRRHAGSRRLRR
jgi:hypothetical protein